MGFWSSSLSQRIILSIFLLLVATVCFSFLLNYYYLKRSLDFDLNSDFEIAKQAIIGDLVINDNQAYLNYDPNNPAYEYGDLRIQIRQAENTLFEAGGEFPLAIEPWVIKKFPVMESTDLDLYLALDHSEHLEELDNFLRVGLTVIPFILLISLFILWALVRRLLLPLKRLHLASLNLVDNKDYTLLEVPRGDDEISQLTKRFNSLNQEINSVLERERVFTRYASHELRTPLAAIQVQLDAWKLNLMPEEEIKENLLILVRQSRQILTSLLSLSRQEKVAFEQLSANTVLEEVLTLFSEEEQQRFNSNFDEQSIAFESNEPLLIQALYNVIENSLKYSDKNIVINLSHDDNYCVFRISDEGGGVPETELPLITNPFYRSSKNQKGYGLGLALTQKIIQSLKGEMELENTQKGLMITFHLPLRINAVTLMP